MRNIPTALQEALDSGATTLARCWQVTRTDGTVLGFTDHDRAVVFASISHEPDGGFAPSALESATGLSAGTHDVSGALRSDRITAADIAKGLYDGAEVSLYLVDWSDPASRLLLSRGQIGEIRHGETAFDAEVTGLADRLNQTVGRAYLHSCDCRLGDAKCGVDLSAPGNRGTGSVLAATGPQQFAVSGLSGFADGWFAGGQLIWTSGQNAGLEAHVKSHLVGGTDTVLALWLSPPMAVEPGDQFEALAGCDKTAATCAGRFDNLTNFRGFPHMPGDDLAASYPSTGGNHDGGSLLGS